MKRKKMPFTYIWPSSFVLLHGPFRVVKSRRTVLSCQLAIGKGAALKTNECYIKIQKSAERWDAHLLSRTGCRTAGRVAYQITVRSMIPYCMDVTVTLSKSVTM